MEENELSLEDQMTFVTEQFSRDIKYCSSYREASEKWALYAIQCTAISLAFLALNEKTKAAFCMKQAATAKIAALSAKALSVIKTERNPSPAQ